MDKILASFILGQGYGIMHAMYSNVYLGNTSQYLQFNLAQKDVAS